MDLVSWAMPSLRSLLPLDDESLKQIVTYTDTLSKDEAAEHLKNLLGDSPRALEFITSFNSRRKPAASGTSPAGRDNQSKAGMSGVPKPRPRKKKATGFKELPPPRQPENYGDTSGGYVKKEEEDYMSGIRKSRKDASPSNAGALQEKPDAMPQPRISVSTARVTIPTPRLPPSAAGPLISAVKPARSQTPKAKVTISGGLPMSGASSALNDLDSAIRALEIQTNPSLAPSTADNKGRKCSCMAARHPLLEAAPNCLHCGKIICVKEGLGPCTFCGMPLLNSEEIQGMIRVLKDERGRERMAANNAAYKKAEVTKTPRPFMNKPSPMSSAPSSAPGSDSETEKLAKAIMHRDKLLSFQANNARRTRIHDEAADFETPTAGQNMWATPQERALQLKRQQKILREQDWMAKPEWERRRVVASIDVVGGRVVKKMATMERPKTPESEEEIVDDAAVEQAAGPGTFSKNPLLGGLIRPVAREGRDKGKEKIKESVRAATWRRVQDGKDDNEEWILDGGVYGGRASDE